MSKCSCGSDEEKHALIDVAGIFCAYVCSKCETDVRRRYNPRIFDEKSAYAISGEEEDLVFPPEE